MLSRLVRSDQGRLHHLPVILGLLLLLLFAAGAAAAPGGGKGGGKPRGTSSTPTISIASPSSGSTVSGPVSVSGSASDNGTSVASVQVSVDGGTYQRATGTTSWSFPLNSASYPDGTHTIAAKATDSSGSTAVTTNTVTFNNTPTPTTPPPDTSPPSVAIAAPAPGSTVSGTVSVSGSAADNISVAAVPVSLDGGPYQAAQGTSSWSYSLDTTMLAAGSHTLSARATDTSGNASTTNENVTVQNSTTLPPGVVQQLVTPEGATINIYSDAVGWTAQQVYDLLKPNAYQLDVIGPTLTIDVTAQYASQTTTSASSSNGVWGNYHATITLQANGTSAFATRPDAIAAHEYGHAWTNYYYYVRWQRDWTPWLQERGLAGNPLLDSSYQWTIREMIADDYRLLFGTSSAQSEMAYINPAIPEPRTVAGLKNWFVNTWG